MHGFRQTENNSEFIAGLPLRHTRIWAGLIEVHARSTNTVSSAYGESDLGCSSQEEVSAPHTMSAAALTKCWPAPSNIRVKHVLTGDDLPQ